MPLATEGGASIWITRSTAPMSMPSSSDEVATIAGELAGLERVFDLEALLAGDRAVVGVDQRLAGQLVQRGGEPLGQAAAVDEDDRRAVLRGSARAGAAGSPARSTALPGPVASGSP